MKDKLTDVEKKLLRNLRRRAQRAKHNPVVAEFLRKLGVKEN